MAVFSNIADGLIDLYAALPALIGVEAATAEKLAEGKFYEAHKVRTAGQIGIWTNTLPAQLIELSEVGLDKAREAGYPLDWLPLAGSIRGLSKGIKDLQKFGMELDGANYNRGKDAAPIADEIIMLPLDMIGVGEALAPVRASLRSTS